MKMTIKGLTAGALAVGLMAVPAQAQTGSWSIGAHGSYLNSGELAENPADVDLKLDNGDAWGGGLEWWFGSGRWGLRFDGSYAHNPWALETGQDNGVFDNENYTRLEQFGELSTYFADASIMLRLLEPTPGRRFAPFLSAGAGLIHWDHEGENVDLEFEPANAYIYGEDQTEFAVAGGVGADIFFSDNVALRLEVKDYWNSDSPYLVLSDQDRDHEGGHNIMYRAGLQFFFGGGEVEEPGFIREEPEPQPEQVVTRPEPEPEPEPEPRSETIRMCVIDDGNFEIRTIRAERMLETREIYVDRNGRRVAFTTVYPTTEPVYVRSASWYVADGALTLNLGEGDLGGDVDDELEDAVDEAMEAEPEFDENRMEFVSFGTATRIPASQLMFVGTIDGTPLYARTSDVGSMRTELQNRLRVNSELDEVLDDEEFATRFANEIETFYLGVEPGETDCVFQPVSSTHVVRRTRG